MACSIFKGLPSCVQHIYCPIPLTSSSGTKGDISYNALLDRERWAFHSNVQTRHCRVFYSTHSSSRKSLYKSSIIPPQPSQGGYYTTANYTRALDLYPMNIYIKAYFEGR